MIYDMRTYTCLPGTVPLQMKLWMEHGMAVQKKHLGEPVMYGAPEVGELNTYVHVWAYDSHAERLAPELRPASSSQRRLAVPLMILQGMPAFSIAAFM